MEYIKLVHTDLIVSRIGFGSEPLGGTDWGNVDMNQAVSAVERALDLGINLFDTADVYGLGKAEEVLSRALGARRHDVVIISKFGINWQALSNGGRARTFRDCSPHRVVTALEQTLRRLRIDTLPLYLIHWPDPHTPIARTLEALLECRQAGKIRHIGVSNFPVHLMHAANQIERLAATEVQYSLVDRGIEQELLPYCREQGISVLTYGPLAQGLLTGKYHTNTHFGTNDRRHRLPHFQPDQLAENLKIVDRLTAVGERYGKHPAQIALRWVLDNPAIACVIVGAKSPVQVDTNVGATGWHLSPEDYVYITHNEMYAKMLQED
jgi:aryl-alcohol dehydrogenase-like predicted oxidoreductase